MRLVEILFSLTMLKAENIYAWTTKRIADASDIA
jgi:hypothetical protein